MKNIKQKKCKNCKGKGYVPVYFEMASRARGIEECPVCKGTGKIETDPKEKRIEELEEKISVLLSCKNCPENKDGLICQKEYENKCLAQKIQYIKELKEENAKLKKQQFSLRNERNTFLRENEQYEKDLIDFNENLAKAKKIIKNLMVFAEIDSREYEKEYKEAEQFLKEVKE